MMEMDFWTALNDPVLKPMAVELDPPEKADLTKFLTGARALRAAGADLITLADCPGGRPRLDSCLTAARLCWEGIPALPHLAARDRNALAAQALLMGLSAEDVGGVLLVTGDKLPGDAGAKAVYQFDSIRLLRFVAELDRTLPRPLRLAAALNVNARNFAVELERAMEKAEAGAEALFTQPLLSEQALENLAAARAALPATVKLCPGVMPIVSRKNADFMNESVPGIVVDPALAERYDGLDRAAAEALAEEISVDFARRAAPCADGYYLITPFGRTALMARIMEGIRTD